MQWQSRIENYDEKIPLIRFLAVYVTYLVPIYYQLGLNILTTYQLQHVF